MTPTSAELREVLPALMIEARRWLVWRSLSNGKEKPRKVPFYIDGAPRNGPLDSPEDVARLGTFDAALTALSNGGDYTGLGFALGDGWQGIDCDDHYDPDRHKLSVLGERIINECNSYTEMSPSGRGIHVIGHGAPFNPIGAAKTDHRVEAYSGGRFFTVTGCPVRTGGPVDCAPIVERLRKRLVQEQARPAEGNADAKTGEGQRNDYLTRVAGKWRSLGLTVGEITAALHVRNQSKCSPPLPDAEVTTIARSIGRYPQGEEAKATDIVVGGALTLAAQMPDVDCVIHPILIHGQLGTFTGHPGHCKTTAFVGIAAALALDRDFGPLKSKAEGLVYIVSAEDMQGTRNRILAEAIRLKLKGDDRTALDARLRWVQVARLASAAEIHQAIEADAKGAAVVLIFVDTGPALFSGDDENDNVALRDFVDGFTCMAELPGRPVTVLAWHPSKGASVDRLEPRGASAIKGSCDFNLTIWRDDEQGVSIGYTKMRAEHFEPFDGRLEAIPLIAASGVEFSAPIVVLDTEEGDLSGDDKARQTREAILTHLLDVPEPGSVRDIAKAVAGSKSAVARGLKHLARAKPKSLVALDPVTDRYALTDAGRERAEEIRRVRAASEF